VILLMATIGSLLAIRLSNTSLLATQCCNCFAGGVLLIVAVVDILPDSAPVLANMDRNVANVFGADKQFPTENVLLIVGFLLIPTIEALLTLKVHKHNHSECSVNLDGDGAQSGTEMQRLSEPLGKCLHLQSSPLSDVTVTPLCKMTWPMEPAQTNTRSAAPASSAEHMHQAQQVNSMSVSTATLLVGLSTHALVEGLATGAAHDVQSVLFILVAIACHKGFAAFALGSALLPLWNAGLKVRWVFQNFVFAFAGAAGILIGALFSMSVDSTGVAILSCVAAGTLLHVGICEMLIPALADPRFLGRKVMITLLSSFCMTLLVTWT